MSFLDRFFNKDEPIDEPDIKFGRYSDTYRTRAQNDAWYTSLEQFEQGKYLDAYRSFFNYLYDKNEDNVHWVEEKGGIRFDISQGSKKIRGFINPHKVTVSTKVAEVDALNVGFMRRLLEINFDLKYSRYALNEENDIVMTFDSYTLDGSPYKFYYALKELATNSDKQDDLLVDEFETLHIPNEGTIHPIPDAEKETKYNFIIQKIDTLFTTIENTTLDVNKYPGGIAYLLLDAVYRLDYLISPEGYMMEALERMHRLYFAKDDKVSTIQKNQHLQKELKKLRERSSEEYYKELYNVSSTFGITSPVGYDEIISILDGELRRMEWYKENGHEEIALAIPGYIVGYCLFNYAVPKPVRDFFQLYYQIMEGVYFKNLGFTTLYYDPSTKKFDKRAIKRAIQQIEDENEDAYPKLDADTSMLNFDSLPDFAESYLLMMRVLNMTKAY